MKCGVCGHEEDEHLSKTTAGMLRQGRSCRVCQCMAYRRNTEVRDPENGNFLGHEPRECGEHRTVGPHRAWCFDCSEWCYPGGPCVRCLGLTSALEGLLEDLKVCMRDHPEDERLERCEAQVRRMLGRRV